MNTIRNLGGATCWLLVPLLAGCTAVNDRAGTRNGNGTPATSTAPATPGVAPGTPGTPGTPSGTPTTPGTPMTPLTPADCAAGPKPGAAPIRRLTPFEYDNTIRDLLTDPNIPSAGLPVEGGGGFDNNAEVGAVTRLIGQKYLDSAEAISTSNIVGNAGGLKGAMGCDPTSGETACVTSWISKFAAGAWRRPLQSTEVSDLLAVYSEIRANLAIEDGVRGVAEAVLQSPYFLYRVEIGGQGALVPITGYEAASRLSYLLWGSMPDSELFQAAEQGRLVTPANIAEQARRMLSNARTKEVAHKFHSQWWSFKDVGTLERDATLYPGFTPEIGKRMLDSTNRFIDYALFEADGSLKTLLTSPRVYLDQSLAGFFGVSMPASTELMPMDVDPARAGGLLTQSAFVTTHAKPNRTSIVSRGVFVRGSLFCQTPPAPPANVPKEPDIVPPGQTTRTLAEQHRADPVCATCHQLFDPLGFAFENYDAVGRWRDAEGGIPIDASGALTGTDVDGPFNGVKSLANMAAQSQLVADCTVTQWFRYGYGRQDSAADLCSMEQLRAAFKTSNFNIPELIVALTQSDAFLYRNPTGAP